VSRRTGLATAALMRHAQKHANLERYLAQGQKRANVRSARAAIDAKVRAIQATYNVNLPSLRGINAKKRHFQVHQTGPEIVREIVRAPMGIPLKYYGAKQTSRGISFMIRRGRTSLIQSGFTVKELGLHGFTRTTRHRLPIRKRFGPGLAQLADAPAVRQAGNERYGQRVTEEIRKEEDRAHRRAKL
jgi:hypothetical protein